MIGRRHAHGLLALVAAAALAAGGCGGDDEDGGGTDRGATATEQPQAQETDTGAAPASAEDPEGAFRQFQSALADGDAETACGLLTDSAREQVENASIGGSCENWVEEFTGVFTDDIRGGLRDVDVTDVRERGDRATVEYRSPILDIPLEAELQRAGDGWRLSKLAEGV